MKDLHKENYKTLKMEIEEDTRTGKTLHVHGSAKLILLNGY
jgi:hypothetical protein